MPDLLVNLIVAVILIALLFWAMGRLKVEDGLRNIITVAVVLIAALWLISMFLGYSSPFGVHRGA